MALQWAAVGLKFQPVFQSPWRYVRLESDSMRDTTLSRSQESRNVALYTLTNGLTYLSAPVVYVGIMQASLCNGFGSSDTVANLPTSAFFLATMLPIVVAWRFHTVSAVRPVLFASYSIMAVAGAIVAAVLYWPMPVWLRLATVVVYGGMIGLGMGIRNVFIWEVVNRGMSPTGRGLAYSLAFGIGPLLAVAGSLGAQLLLTGEVDLPWISSSSGIVMKTFSLAPLSFPLNFALLFGATVPILGVAAALAGCFVLPPAMSEAPRPPFVSSLISVGSEIRQDRVLLFAVLAYLLVDAGFTITNNMALYTSEALGKPPEDFAGYQNALRFSFKMAGGLLLGWLLVRTHAKMGMLVTGGLVLAGIAWVLLTPNNAWFLICFGLMGAGELYGVYYPNYLMNRSHPDRVRHHMALLQLLSLATALVPAGFGAISDEFGLHASFVVAAGVVGASLALIAFGLPSNPRLESHRRWPAEESG